MCRFAESGHRLLHLIANTPIMKEKIQLSDLKKRDPHAIQALYERNFPIVLKFVTLNTGSIDEARGIFHDAVFILMERIREKQLDESANFTLHLYSIARILWIDMMREKLMDEGNVKHIHEFLELDPKSIRSKIVGVKRLSAQFKSLAEPGRTIVREHIAHGVSLSEISRRMGFSSEESAVKNKYKALKSLMESGS